MADNILLPWTCPDCGKQRMLKRRRAHVFCSVCYLRQWKSAHKPKGYDYGPLYDRWNGMKQRCRDPHCRAFKNYGGRGISVHPDWLDFKRFKADILREIGPCPSPQHELDRIDNNSNYEPGNVRWATAKEQGANKRNNRVLTLNGESHTVAEWSRLLNINVYTLWQRLQMGWSGERTLTQPLGQRENRILTLNGESHTLIEWAGIRNMSVWTLWKRIEMGWSEERALTEPVRKYKK